jgi:D-alanyl-D-alanine dipeptidase
VIALDNAWIDAEVRRDRAALERILDEQFLATFASGRTIDRTAFIDRMMKAAIEPFEVVHDVIRIHGDTAVVIDSSSDGTSKYTWIAVKRQGQWRVISETFSNVAAAK